MEFTPWPKTPRLFRDAIITEKIDGTNAAVIVKLAEPSDFEDAPGDIFVVDSVAYRIGAQSRSRLIYPGQDNFAFAKWVWENACDIIRVLGEGVHFGEWWGSGIQRGYGLTGDDKRFSLFNVNRYQKLLQEACLADIEVPGLSTVPLLDAYTFSTERVRKVLAELAETGSQAAPGFMRPEGVIVFHSQSRSVYKALLENDDQPKGAQ